MDNSLVERLYESIETELDFCDSATTPHICAMLSDAQSKSLLIKTIANVAISGRMNISQAIAEVERENSQNNL